MLHQITVKKKLPSKNSGVKNITPIKRFPPRKKIGVIFIFFFLKNYAVRTQMTLMGRGPQPEVKSVHRMRGGEHFPSKPVDKMHPRKMAGLIPPEKGYPPN